MHDLSLPGLKGLCEVLVLILIGRMHLNMQISMKLSSEYRSVIAFFFHLIAFFTANIKCIYFIFITFIYFFKCIIFVLIIINYYNKK